MPRRRARPEKPSTSLARDPHPHERRAARRAAASPVGAGPRLQLIPTQEQERDYAAAHEWRWRLIWAPLPSVHVYGGSYPWAGVLIRWEEDTVREFNSIAPNHTYAGKYHAWEAPHDTP